MNRIVMRQAPVAEVVSGVIGLMRRWKLLVVIASPIALLVAGTFVYWSGSTPISRENYDRIQPGMSRRDVEEILGRPGDYSLRPAKFSRVDENSIRHATMPASGANAFRRRWATDTAYIQIDFDQFGRVASCLFGTPVQDDRGWFGNLAWRVERQWCK
jgi:hypothetical protein